jgi:hypothetical protein
MRRTTEKARRTSLKIKEKIRTSKYIEIKNDIYNNNRESSRIHENGGESMQTLLLKQQSRDYSINPSAKTNKISGVIDDSRIPSSTIK